MNDYAWLIKECRELGRVSHRGNLYTAAADAIESLQSQRNLLRVALQSIEDTYVARSDLFTNDVDCAANLYDRAVLALKE